VTDGALNPAAGEALLEPAFRDLIRLTEAADGRPRLIGLQCGRCGQYSIGQQRVCPNCHSNDLKEKALSRRATLYSFSVTHLPPFGFAAPLAVGLVDLPEGLRIWTQLKADDLSQLKIGQELELVVGPLRVDSGGREIIGYQFRPAAGQGE
jgi:benzoylsuccinyl-CoA thiolase BbsA subunit